MKRKTKYISAAVLALIIIGIFLGFYMYNKPVKDFAGSEAEITLSAKELFNAFAKDQNKATTEYVSADKIILIEGKILEINKSSENQVNIILDVDDPDGDISCTLVKDKTGKSEKYKPGDIIKIQGQCTGYQELINKEVIMIRCGIVE